MHTLTIKTGKREEMIDVTSRVSELISQNGWKDGAVLLYCPHTTGAVTVNEGADPSVSRDILVHLGRLAPARGDYRHAEGNSDAHIKSSMFGCEQSLIVSGGQLALGTWQRVFFCEFDGPRTRKLHVQWLGE
jgi:secondary thiamine-phosphate synthase enzyme